MNYCFIIPHYNHELQFLRFLPSLLSRNIPCIIVDDGSSLTSIDMIKTTIGNNPKVHIFTHGYNRGKGAAVKTGLCHARALGFTHAIQIDADGQHNVDDVASMITLSKTHPNAIICGKPVYDSSVPKERLYGRKVTDFWVAIETLSLSIKDALCGFRIYPLHSTEAVIDSNFIGNRMDFDTDILVKACWLKVPLVFIDTLVIYPEKSVSHFHYIRDNMLLIGLHTRLVLGMFVRLPKLTYHLIQRNFLSQA